MTERTDPNVNREGLSTRVYGNIDRSITSLSGSSQLLMPASTGQRKRIIFANGAATAAVNIKGGTAAIGGAGCITLQPYEKIAFTGDDCPMDAIYVIGTATFYFNAFEGR